VFIVRPTTLLPVEEHGFDGLAGVIGRTFAVYYPIELSGENGRIHNTGFLVPPYGLQRPVEGVA